MLRTPSTVASGGKMERGREVVSRWRLGKGDKTIIASLTDCSEDDREIILARLRNTFTVWGG